MTDLQEEYSRSASGDLETDGALAKGNSIARFSARRRETMGPLSQSDGTVGIRPERRIYFGEVNSLLKQMMEREDAGNLSLLQKREWLELALRKIDQAESIEHDDEMKGLREDISRELEDVRKKVVFDGGEW